MLGYTRDELLTMGVQDVELEFERLIPHRRNLLVGETMTFHGTHKRKDGSTYPVEVTIAIHVFNGKQFGVSVVRDQTTRMRTQHAEKQQLIMRERADFTSNLSHDIRNPLIGIRRVLDFMAQGTLGPTTEEQARALTQASQAVSDTLQILQNLISSYRQGKVESEVFTTVDNNVSQTLAE